MQRTQIGLLEVPKQRISLSVHTVTLSQAQQHLSELVRELTPDSEVVIVDANKPVAKLFGISHPSLRDLRPTSVGAVLRSFPRPEDDTLGEMLGSEE